MLGANSQASMEKCSTLAYLNPIRSTPLVLRVHADADLGCLQDPSVH